MDDDRESLCAELTAGLVRQARKGIFPQLMVPPKQEVRILTKPTFVSCHWTGSPPTVLCRGKGCEFCSTMITKTVGHILVVTREPRIHWLKITEEEFVPLEDAMIVGLRVRIDRRERSSQLQIEVHQDQRPPAYELPDVSIDAFVARLYQASAALVETAKGYQSKQQPKPAPEPNLLPFEQPHRRQA